MHRWFFPILTTTTTTTPFINKSLTGLPSNILCTEYSGWTTQPKLKPDIKQTSKQKKKLENIWLSNGDSTIQQQKKREKKTLFKVYGLYNVFVFLQKKQHQQQ